MIHQYRQNGYHIVLDVYSGAIHSVDALAYDVIQMAEDHTDEAIVETLLKRYAGDPTVDEGEIRECLEDVAELKARGKLFSEDLYADKATVLKDNSTVVKALCLHVAHTCNLDCDYCFASQGKYNGDRAIMGLDVGKRALDFLIENSGTRRNLDVDFFGGEPLMNWDVVKDIVRYGRELEEQYDKKFRFTLTTNGVLLDEEVTEFANAQMHNVVLSLDGRKEVHDSLRKTINGKGSYDTIVPKFQKFVEARGDKEYYMRGTFTHANADFTNDVFHMADLGFKELSMEPVVCAPDDPYALTDEDLPILYKEYEKLAEDMLRRKREGEPITFYHYLLNLEGGPCIYKRISGCGVGTEYMAVTPWGDLYPCHQFVGDEGYALGDIWNGVKTPALQDDFKKVNVYAREACQKCWAKLYCSGGCAANAYHATGDITGIYEYGCKLFRKRVECAIMMKVVESEEGL